MSKKPSFSIKLLDDTYKRTLKKKGVWASKCPVSLERLRIVDVSYYDFKNEVSQGKLVVLDAVATFVMTIFQDLFQRQFPIQKMIPIDEYDGSDDASMEDNNSSAFNYREIPGRGVISIHSYGLAIDVNTVQNPFMGNSYLNKEKGCSMIEVWPTKGIEYINRFHQRKGMVEPIVDIFHKYGFRDWGGHWKDLMDYHHFQTPRYLAFLLSEMIAEDAVDFFRWYVDHPQCVLDEKNILKNYKKSPKDFMKQYS